MAVARSAQGPMELCFTGRRLRDHCRQAALCADSLLVRQWAVRGEGVAYKASVDVAADLREGRLVRLLGDYEGEAVPISAVMPSGRHVPTRVRAMVDHLARRFAGL